MDTFAKVRAKVVVRDDPVNGTGEVLFTDSAPLDARFDSLEQLHAAAMGFPHSVGAIDWFEVGVETRAKSMGGDSQTVTAIVEFLGEVRGLAYEALAAMFAAYIVENLRKPDSDRDD
jgi:hypothetical protein